MGDETEDTVMWESINLAIPEININWKKNVYIFISFDNKTRKKASIV